MGTGNYLTGGGFYNPKQSEEDKRRMIGALSFDPTKGTQQGPDAPIDPTDSTETIIGKKLLDQAMSGIGGGSAATGAAGTAGLGTGGLTGALSSGAGAAGAGAGSLMTGLGGLLPILGYMAYKRFS